MVNHNPDDKIKECLDPARRALQRAHEETKAWTPAFLPLMRAKREKRSFALLAGTVFGFLANSAFSLFHLGGGETTSPTVEQFTLQLQRIREEFGKHITELNSDINQHYKEIRCLRVAAAANTAAAHVHGITDAVLTTLHTGKVTPTLLPPDRVMAIWPNISRIAAEHRAHLPPAHAIYELPAHFQQSEDGLVIIISIPLITATLELWSPANFPLSLPSGPHWVHMLENQHLALDTSTATFAVFDDADLSSCPKIGGHWFCHDPVRYSRADTTCAAALFHSDTKAAARICRTSPYRGGMRAVRTANDTFSVYSPDASRLTVACNTAQRWTLTLPAGFNAITLAPGCTASNTNISLSVPPKTDIFVDLVTNLDWTMEHEDAMATPAFQTHTMRTSASWPVVQHAAVTIPASTGAGLIGGATLAAFLWIRHRRNTRAAASHAPAIAATTTQQQETPDS